MGDNVRYFAKVAIGTAAALLLGSQLMYWMDEDHSYEPGSLEGGIKERKARLETHNWFPEHYFINKDGLAIRWFRWLPQAIAQPQVKSIVILVHGLGEHSSRNVRLAKKLAALGYAVYTMDHQGHGTSEGSPRLYVKFFSDLVADVHQLTEMAKENHPEAKKVFLVGHSMGSLISIHSVHSAPRLYDGVALSAPPLKLELPPGGDKAVQFIASIFPKLPAPGLELSTLCRDTSVVDRYFNDPLNNQGPIRIRLMSELIKAINEVPTFSENFPIPYLLMHGTGDKVCLYDGSKGFHASTKTQDKTFKTYEGAYHELFNEPDAEEYAIKDTIEWLEKRV